MSEITMRCVYCFTHFAWKHDRILAQCDECRAKEHDEAMRKLVRHSFARRLYHRVRLLFTPLTPRKAPCASR